MTIDFKVNEIYLKRSYESAERFGLRLVLLNFDEFLEKKSFEDALYYIDTGSTPVCIVIKNNKKNNFGLLSFTGALSKNARKGNYVPNFAGLNIANDFDMPFVAISDPSIFLSDKIVLTWYVGSLFLKLQSLLPRLIDHISNVLAINFLAFGGSGGGFSALYYATKTSSIKKILVWNPQTNIVKYYERFWKEMALACFEEPVSSEHDFYNLMNKYGVEYDLTKDTYLCDLKSIVYLQNFSDWHLESHAKPFIKKNLVETNSFLFENKNIRLIVGEWGEGHAVPSTESLKKIISFHLKDQYSNIYDHVLSVTDVYQKKKKTVENTSMEVEVKRENGFIKISNLNPNVFETAFYINKHGVIKKEWYTAVNSTTIKEKDLNESLVVTVFSKDAMGNVEFKKITNANIKEMIGVVLLDIKVKLKLSNISAVINLNANEDEYLYAFYLVKGNKKIQRTSYSTNKSYNVDIQEVGQYKIVGFAKNIFSNEILFESSNSFIYNPAQLEKIKKSYRFLIKGDYAKLIETGYKPRADVKPVIISKEMDWFHNDRNVEVSIQSLRFLSPIWEKLFSTNDASYYNSVIELFYSWYKSVDKKNIKYAWYDMAVAIRAQHLALVVSVMNYFPTSDEDKKIIINNAFAHVKKLSDPKKLGHGNHAIYQLIGLAMLVKELELEGSHYEDYYKENMEHLLKTSFDENYVNVENSPFYHNYNLSLVKTIPSELFPECKQLIKNIIEFGANNTAWLTSPLGCFYNIGDSEGKGLALIKAPQFDFIVKGKEYISKDIYSSGYQVVRTSPSAKINSEFFVFHATSKSKIHAHVDHLSFIFGLDSEDVIVDCGKYTYERNSWRNYFKGSKGHNSIGLKSTEIKPDDIYYDQIFLTPLNIDSQKKCYRFSGFLKNKYFAHKRDIKYFPSRKITILDNIVFNGNLKDKAELRLNLSPAINIKQVGKKLYLLKNDINIGVLRFKANCDMSVSFHKGEIDPVNGWFSNQYNSKKATYVVSVELSSIEKFYLITELSFF